MNGRAFLSIAALLSVSSALAPLSLLGQEPRVQKPPPPVPAAREPAARERAAQPPAAQQARERSAWFPDTTAFAPLLAAPRETALRAGFKLAERRPIGGGPIAPAVRDEPFALGDYAGRNLEAEVAVGHRIPVILLRREGIGPSLVLEFEVGTFSRFFMESEQRDLINIDYQVGVPLSVGWRDWEGRVQVRHISSHAGDDFARRFGIGIRQVSLEGFELLLGRRMGDVRAYVGGEAYVHATRDLERTAARVGVELDPRRPNGERGARPYAALDFRVNSAVERLEGSGVAGVGFRLRGVGLRFEGRGHFGPSAMGWLRRSEETFIGLGMRVEL